MRAFGSAFVLVGALLAGVGARAIGDADNYGWDEWQRNPWSLAIIVGGSIAVGGIALVIAGSKVSQSVNRMGVRMLSTLVVGFVAFALLAPTGCSIACSMPGSCRTQECSNLMGISMAEDPNYAWATAAAAVGAIVTWMLVRQVQSRRS
jgi:hypothetical protein